MKYYGFIYMTTNNITGKIYIGKKNYEFTRKKKLTKKELAEIKTKGRKPVFKKVVTESDWRNYYGSSEELLKDIERLGKENFSVKIIHNCVDKLSLTYWETYYQFYFKVLFVNSYNGHILGKFYRGKVK